MIPYFVVLILIFLFAFADRISKDVNWKVLIFIIFTLFAGLRYNVGIDYKSYVKSFEGVLGSYVHEPGTNLIFSIIKLLGGSAQLYFLLMAAVTQVFVYKILNNQQKNFWIIVIVYYCVSLFYMASFNAVRQYASIAIVTWSLQFINKNQFKKYCLVILFVTFFFHYSALVFIPLFFFLKKRYPIWILIGLIGVVYILYFIELKIIAMTPYAKYENLKEFREVNIELIQYLFTAVSFVIMLVGNRFRFLRNNVVIYNMNCLCLYLLILVMLQDNELLHMLFQRYCNYFIFSYLLIIPLLLSSMRKTNAMMTKNAIVIVSVLYLLRTIIIKGEQHELVPYDFNLVLF